MTFARRVAAGLSANIFGQGLGVVIQLVSVPLFLRVWGPSAYGEWLLLTVAPAYVAVTDFGLQAVAMNQICVSAAKGETAMAVSLLRSLSLFISILAASVIGISLSLQILGVFPRGDQYGFALPMLITCSALGLFGGVFDSIFRANDFYSTGTALLDAGRFLEWLGGMIGLFQGGTFSSVALGMLTARLSLTIFFYFLSRKRFPKYGLDLRSASLRPVLRLRRSAAAWMAFRLGDVFSLQGVTIIVGLLLPTASVARFNVYRTAVRSLVQAVSVVSNALWPEFARARGEANQRQFDSIFFFNRTWTAVSSIVGVAVLATFGKTFITYWTHGSIPYIRQEFTLFLTYGFFAAYWYSYRIILVAMNRLGRLSQVFVAVACLTPAIAYLMGLGYGLTGVIAAMVLGELIMTLAGEGIARVSMRDSKW